MNSQGLQNTFEPGDEGHKSTFGSIDPTAVERALKVKARIEAARKARSRTVAPVEEYAGCKT